MESEHCNTDVKVRMTVLKNKHHLIPWEYVGQPMNIFTDPRKHNVNNNDDIHDN